MIDTIVNVGLGLSATRPEDLGIVQVCFRALTVYLVLIGYVRFGKKRFLGQATALDAILVIIIGSVASRAISGTAPFISSLAAAFSLIAIHWVLSYFTESSSVLSYLTKGHDTIIIKRGRINRKALRDAHMSEDDLAEDLRQNGVANASQVKEARLERNGRLSVIRK